MKPLLIAFTSLALGSALGWFGHSWQKPTLATDSQSGKNPGASTSRVEPVVSQAKAVESQSASPGVTKPVSTAEFLEQGIVAAAQANQALGAAAFADKLAELLTGDISLEDRVEAEGMKRLLNPERFTAFYAAYAKRTNLHDSDTTLNPMLIKLGQQFGRKAMDTMLASYPDGFERMDSLLHGWGMGDPAGAVQWFNDLPETHSRYNKILQGLVWGLAAKDGAMAGEVVATLSPSDQQKAMYGFSSSFIETHGLKAFDAWADTAPPEIAPQALREACLYATFRPPAEYVPWFASRSATIGIRQEMHQGFGQWFTATPSEALNWLAALPEEKISVQRSLAGRLSPAAAQRFVAENPNHPAAPLLLPTQQNTAR
jgi:hypothetical protein